MQQEITDKSSEAYQRELSYDFACRTRLAPPTLLCRVPVVAAASPAHYVWQLVPQLMHTISLPRTVVVSKREQEVGREVVVVFGTPLLAILVAADV